MNATTRNQTMRLLKAGCPGIRTGMDGHRITFESIQLDRLWDMVHVTGCEYEIPTELTSAELVEALVAILEKHYTQKYNP